MVPLRIRRKRTRRNRECVSDEPQTVLRRGARLLIRDRCFDRSMIAIVEDFKVFVRIVEQLGACAEFSAAAGETARAIAVDRPAADDSSTNGNLRPSTRSRRL